MPTRNRKGRRYRGSRTHGYGQIGQHRHSGKQGGHGTAGLHKPNWSWLILYDADHFGSDPFRRPGPPIQETWINVGHLDALAKGTKSVDLVAMGVRKLLGSGTVTSAYEVKVGSATKRAQAKIEAAGGKVVLQE